MDREGFLDVGVLGVSGGAHCDGEVAGAGEDAADALHFTENVGEVLDAFGGLADGHEEDFAVGVEGPESG